MGHPADSFGPKPSTSSVGAGDGIANGFPGIRLKKARMVYQWPRALKGIGAPILDIAPQASDAIWADV